MYLFKLPKRWPWGLPGGRWEAMETELPLGRARSCLLGRHCPTTQREANSFARSGGPCRIVSQ